MKKKDDILLGLSKCTMPDSPLDICADCPYDGMNCLHNLLCDCKEYISTCEESDPYRGW